MRHGRWRLFGIRCIFPWGSMIFQCTQNLFTLNSDTNPFICLFLHINKYLCIFYKRGGHLRMVAYRRDRLPPSSVRLARGPGGLPKDVPNPQQIALNWILTLLTPVAVYSTPIGNDWHHPRVLIPIWIMQWLFHLPWMVWLIT